MSHRPSTMSTPGTKPETLACSVASLSAIRSQKGRKLDRMDWEKRSCWSKNQVSEADTLTLPVSVVLQQDQLPTTITIMRVLFALLGASSASAFIVPQVFNRVISVSRHLFHSSNVSNRLRDRHGPRFRLRTPEGHSSARPSPSLSPLLPSLSLLPETPQPRPPSLRRLLK